MPEKILQPSGAVTKGELKELVRSRVEETRNGLPEQEAEHPPTPPAVGIRRAPGLPQRPL
jgi:hypothetical protein